MLAVSNFVLAAAPSFAKGGELGILEGRTAALIHPATMGFLLVASLYAGYLGLKVRNPSFVYFLFLGISRLYYLIIIIFIIVKNVSSSNNIIII